MNSIVITDLHLALSEKLNWGAMLATVAVPTLDLILRNYKDGCIFHFGPEWDDEMFEFILNMNPDNIFCLLMGNNSLEFDTPAEIDFKARRQEIEGLMFDGFQVTTIEC